eukprot:COSAG05_NODE_272_length_12454_cov_1460.218085_7_plen_55_part_00
MHDAREDDTLARQSYRVLDYLPAVTNRASQSNSSSLGGNDKKSSFFWSARELSR